MKRYEFILKNLDCANCANKIQNKLSENPNYKNVIVNFNTLKLTFDSEIENVKPEIEKIIAKLEPEVEVLDVNNFKNNKSYSKANLYRLIFGIIIMIFALYIELPGYLNFILTIFAYIILLFRTAKNAIKLLLKRTIDENFLVTISCIGAYFIGQQTEGLMVIILYEIGKLLEEKAINNTRKSISELMNIKPEYANLKHENHELKVNPEEVNIGDIIVVKQGEKIPIDGVIVNGEASLNTSSLTGESKLQDVKINDTVLSGSINEKGLIEIKTIRKYKDSTVNKIIELVENATDKKAKTETFVNKASRIYTPIVLLLAIIVVFLLPLISSITYKESIYRALIFLVISCPCAIVISVPLSYFSGIGKASKFGILIKGSNYLDSLKNLKTIVFDKTGTLTKGEFGVEKIKSINKYSDDELLEYAALGEINSNHPIAIAILKEYKMRKNIAEENDRETIKNSEQVNLKYQNEQLNNIIIDNKKITQFQEIAGKGLLYKIDDKTIKVGNNEFVDLNKQEYKKMCKNEIGTIIFVKIDDEIIGYIVLNDSIKPESKNIISKLKNLGIKTMMFTGDNKDIAEKVGNKIEINEIKYEMLPTDKYKEMEKLISRRSENERIAFVGDGINDSPVLALSDIGISMGGIGASSAIEASDIVIMTDDLNKIEEAINISKVTNMIIKQNLIFAMSIKVLVLLLSVIGIAQMWMAVFADVGVTLLTILNTIRILKK